MTAIALPVSRYCPRCGADSDADRCPHDGTPTFVRATQDAGTGAFKEGEVIGGRYRVTGILGSGGFGAVFAAEHIATGQAAAVKVMSAEHGALPQDAIQRFQQEARVTSALNHPNTVRIYDFGQTENGVLFMAMERLRGPTLEARLEEAVAQGTALSEAETVNIGIQVLRSLTEAHAAGLVHRDLKPANLILAELVGEPSIVKVLDFGIARTHDSSLTAAGTALGTPHFMSPEQGLGLVPDGRADLYALGCILFACVVGEPPFDDPNPIAVLVQHQTDPLPDLRGRAKVPVSDAFIEVVRRATSKVREDRYANAPAMREALEAVLAARPTAEDEYGAPTLESNVITTHAVLAAQIGREPAVEPPAIVHAGPLPSRAPRAAVRPPDPPRVRPVLAPEPGSMPSAPGARPAPRARSASPARRQEPSPRAPEVRVAGKPTAPSSRVTMARPAPVMTPERARRAAATQSIVPTERRKRAPTLLFVALVLVGAAVTAFVLWATRDADGPIPAVPVAAPVPGSHESPRKAQLGTKPHE